MRCNRCAGLVVAEQFIGGASPNGGWVCAGLRCVNCGSVNFPYQAGVPLFLRGASGCKKSGRVRRATITKVRRHGQQSDHR